MSKPESFIAREFLLPGVQTVQRCPVQQKEWLSLPVHPSHRAKPVQRVPPCPRRPSETTASAVHNSSPGVAANGQAPGVAANGQAPGVAANGQDETDGLGQPKSRGGNGTKPSGAERKHGSASCDNLPLKSSAEQQKSDSITINIPSFSGGDWSNTCKDDKDANAREKLSEGASSKFNLRHVAKVLATLVGGSRKNEPNPPEATKLLLEVPATQADGIHRTQSAGSESDCFFDALSSLPPAGNSVKLESQGVNDNRKPSVEVAAVHSPRRRSVAVNTDPSKDDDVLKSIVSLTPAINNSRSSTPSDCKRKPSGFWTQLLACCNDRLKSVDRGLGYLNREFPNVFKVLVGTVLSSVAAVAFGVHFSLNEA